MSIRLLRVAAPWLLTLLASAALATDEAPTAAEPAEFEPVRLGTTRAELEERFGDALRPAEVSMKLSAFEQIAKHERKDDAPTEEADPFAGQQRLTRSVANPDLLTAEYDLFQGVVYRTRWRLAEGFEQPLMTTLIPHLAERLGKPDYDQTIKAKLGSGKSDLRRTGWRRGNRTLEIRQLHPFTGGPLFVSLSDVEAMGRIVTAKGVALPQPETTGAWWSRPQRDVSLPTAKERARLVRAIDTLLAKIEFEQP